MKKPSSKYHRTSLMVVNIDSDKGNKLLLELMLTKFYVAIWRHKATLSYTINVVLILPVWYWPSDYQPAAQKRLKGFSEWAIKSRRIPRSRYAWFIGLERHSMYAWAWIRGRCSCTSYNFKNVMNRISEYTSWHQKWPEYFCQFWSECGTGVGFIKTM